jgi:hypothetical protein
VHVFPGGFDRVVLGVVMQVITVQGFDQSILDITEAALVEGATKTGELIQAFADAMCEVFDVRGTNGELVCKWYSLRGKDAKGVKARRASFVQKMMASANVDGVDKEGNPKASATVDTYWARVKAASGYVPNGKVSGATDVDAKTAAELKTMINRILNAEEDGKDVHASTILESLKSAYFVLVGESFDAGK